MRSTRIRLQVAALIFILLPASAGVIAVHASATCERFVRTYVTKPVKNRVSKTTADAWAAWRVAHPNWKPNPNLHRPKYVMTREEQVHKVDFACEVPTDPATRDIIFTTAELEPPPVVLPPSMSTQTAFPEMPSQETEVTPWPPLAAYIPPPPVVVPQTNTGIPGPTPEPFSVALVATGMAGLWLLLANKRRDGIPAA